MKNKFENEEIACIMGKIAEDVRDKMDYDFRVAQSQMWIAENDLVDSLNENQHQLYKEYAEKRETFFKIAKELYERKF